jgi:hypothetical protein
MPGWMASDSTPSNHHLMFASHNMSLLKHCISPNRWNGAGKQKLAVFHLSCFSLDVRLTIVTNGTIFAVLHLIMFDLTSAVLFVPTHSRFHHGDVCCHLSHRRFLHWHELMIEFPHDIRTFHAYSDFMIHMPTCMRRLLE